MDYDNPQFVAAVKKIANVPLEAVVDALRVIGNELQQQNATIKEATNSHNERQHSPSLRAELHVPPADRYKKEADDARKSIIGIPKMFLEIFGFIVLVAYTTVAAFQWGEMRKATKASADAAETAVIALDENKWQFRNSLNELRKQTQAQRDSATASLVAADTARKQQELMQQQIDMTFRQAAANLVIQDFNVDIPPGWRGTTTVTFNLVNVGGSAATEIRQDGYPGVYHRHEEAIAGTDELAKPDPIQGFSLDKGQKKPFTVDASNWYDIRNSRTGGDWYDWMRFTYVDIFGRTDSVCVLMLAGKHGISRSDCAPPSYPKKKH